MTLWENGQIVDVIKSLSLARREKQFNRLEPLFAVLLIPSVSSGVGTSR
jgi:hypothetical protein